MRQKKFIRLPIETSGGPYEISNSSPMEEIYIFKDKVIYGDALKVLQTMPCESVNCCISSPPYWKQRDYGIEGQLGQEKTIDEYIDKLCCVYDEVYRILRKDGTCWVNIGDTYNNSNGFSRSTKSWKRKGRTSGSSDKQLVKELPEKSLCLIPFRFAIFMVRKGWLMRNTIIWHKRSCMPYSVKDRYTVDFEYVFFFVKSKKYWFEIQYESQKKRDARCVWDIPAQPFNGEKYLSGIGHFAVFPERLIIPMIKAGCPAEGIVLDPFMGSGTVGTVAKQLNRHYIGIELNKSYVELAEKRIAEEKS